MTALARDLAFSLKTFGAGMLAAWIALRLDLPQPTWALLTAYIVSQPLAGAVLAKSAARIAGTFAGAAMAVTLIACFADAREFFVAGLALWVGACLYVSILLRDAPGSYGAMLAGYTAAIVGFAAVETPLAVFDTAVARVTEICLGIGCATLVSRVVLPLTAGRVLVRTVRDSVQAARLWAADVLRGTGDDRAALADRRKLLADLMTVDLLRAQARLDTPRIRAQDETLRHLQARLLSLASILVSIQDRHRLLLRDRPDRALALAPLLDDAAAAIEAGRPVPGLRRRLAAALPDLAALRADPARRLEYIVLARLRDVLTTMGELRGLARAFLRGEAKPGKGPAPGLARYRDHTQALVGALVAALALAAVSAFWIGTGWSYGGTAATLVVVVCSLMATLDDPAAGALGFLKLSAVAIPVAALYDYAVFPAIDGFTQLAVSLGLVLVPLGLLIPNRRFAPMVMPLIMSLIAIIGLQNRPVLAFEAFLNAAFALILGIGASVVLFRLLRPLGVDWTVQRHVEGIRRDLAALCAAPAGRDHGRFASHTFDRINALITRLGPDDLDHRAILQGSLAALRIGHNILFVQQALGEFDPALRAAAGAGIAALGRHFAGAGAGPDLLAALDAATARALAADAPEAHVTTLVVALSGIRTSLGEHAGFFRLPPESAPAPPEEVAA
ncbi:FUSC family protein [Zavarzinia compransoris]|nr:FUSC family protein [Zavarzinia compransoris]TDP48857.1 putative membrane protein YccC [Zavarzinia compransoris]